MARNKTANFVAWILLLSSDTAAQLLFKMAAVNFKQGIWLSNLPFALAYIFELSSFVIWMFIIKYSRLSISLALTALLYITVSIGSYLFFHEAIKPITWLGTSFITLGACMLGFLAGKKVTTDSPTSENH
jgi:drug/metabolite transporter (DMT)-like permease